MDETASVYQLVTKLCANLIKESDESVDGLNVNCAKRIAFKVLLKNNFGEIPNNEELLQELQFSSFELLLAGRNKDAKVVNQFTEGVKVNSSTGLESIIWFLMHLKNIDPDPESVKNQKEKNFFKIPSNLQLMNKRNVYLPSSTQKLINLPSAASTPDDSCNFFSGILDAYTGNKKKNNSLQSNKQLKCIEAKKPEESRVRKLKLIKTWENLSAEEELVKSFSSESSISIYHHLTASKFKHSVDVKTISFAKLLNDIKLLTIGIESESFKRTQNDLLTFEMVVNLSCEDISNVSQFVEEFLEAGTCFRRLKTFTSKNPFNQSFIFEGFIFKAFGDSVIKFMNTYRDIVYSQEVDTLLEFSSNTRKIRKILVHLTKFLRIHPTSAYHNKLPSGSDFLAHLYNEYATIFDNDVKCFFVNCLKSCCQVYFIHFHKWLFHGFIDDPYRELFIYFVDHYRPNTKYFFDKAYLIRKQSVPGFLQGFAETILLCGKYTMLLKSYNQVHPLFMINKPPLKVCLTNEDMLDMRAQFKVFTKEARAACGKSISIEKIMKARKREKSEKFKKAEDASVRNIQKWRKEQEDRRNEINEKRELKMQELQKELRRIDERKMVKRMEEIQAERDYMEEVEEIESRRVEEENVELQRKINVYHKLNEQLDKDIEKREEIVVKLKNTLESKKDDEVNANEVEEVTTTDEMNNFVAKENLTEAQRNKLKVLSSEYETFELNEEENGNTTTGCEKIVTEAQRNKLKVLSHEYNFTPDGEDKSELNGNAAINPVEKLLSEAQKNKLKVLSHELKADDETTPVSIEKPLNDAQRNKLKVMAHEFQSVPPIEEEKSVSNVNRPLSDAQKNKMKVMGCEFGMIDEKPSFPPKISVQSCENLSDLQRNRLKVLSHEFNIENDNQARKMSLNLLQVEQPQQHIESPMSITSDHFSSESENHLNKSPDGETSEMEKSQVVDDDSEQLEMLRAFEEAVEKNCSNFMGINLESFASTLIPNYDHIKTTDTMAMSKFLQMSLMVPVNAYMDILNNETIKLFVEDLDILSNFKSLRNYFLMMNGEFSISICHELFSKLESGVRPVELLNYSSLHMILDHALSRSRHDSNTEKLSFIVQNIPDKFELYSPAVLNMLTMSYKLEWPLTLILNPETMEQYQAIFNYLLKLKRISWVLEQCFQLLKELGKQHGNDLLRSQQFRNAQQIRHKMTHFVHCLENHVTRNVLQISWNAFVGDLKSAQSIHGIYRKHTSYLKRVLFLCLLNKKSYDFQKTIEDSFRVILKFHKHLKEWKNFAHPRYEKIETDGNDFERLIKYIIYLGNKIIQHGYQKEIFDLLYLIDINCYYSNS